MFLLTADASSGMYADTTAITTAHLILIAVLIVLVIGAILWGARQKHNRAQGEKIEAERAEQMLAHPPSDAAVSPAPPPLGDEGETVATAPVAAKPKPVARPRAAAQPTVAKAPAAKAAPARKPAVPKTPVADPAAPRPKAVPAPAAKTAKPAAPKAPAPVAAAAKSPAKPKAAPAPAASPYGLIDVKGLGPKAVPLLNGLGVTTLADLAGLAPARAAEIDGQLGALSGRMARDKWIDQAKLLVAGDVAGFETAYGKL